MSNSTVSSSAVTCLVYDDHKLLISSSELVLVCMGRCRVQGVGSESHFATVLRFSRETELIGCVLCVCVCVCIYREREKEGERNRERLGDLRNWLRHL